MSKINVGIIGLSAKPGVWASTAHLPAIRATSDFEVTTLTASTTETAKQASEKFNIPNYFADAKDLANHKDVDLVVVSVRVPDHFQLVETAINAGKTVYCEWPLARNLEEALKLESLAKEKNVKGFVGLQARSSPAIQFIDNLVKSGYVGDVLSTSLICSGAAWGDFIDSRNAYLNDKNNGATMLSIPIGHSLDAVCSILGEFKELSATSAVRRDTVVVFDTKETIKKTSPDQIVIQGVLTSGAVISVHYRSGTCRGTNCLWEINGTKGDLQITADNGHLQLATIKIKGATGDEKTLSDLEVPKKFIEFDIVNENPSAFALAHAYSNLRRDIKEGSHLVPTFSDAVKRHRMLETVQKAIETGQKQTFETN